MLWVLKRRASMRQVCFLSTQNTCLSYWIRKLSKFLLTTRLLILTCEEHGQVSKAVVLLLLTFCLLLLPLWESVIVLCFYMLLYVHSSIAIILMGKRELVALLNLSSWCLMMGSGSSLRCHWVVCGL